MVASAYPKFARKTMHTRTVNDNGAERSSAVVAVRQRRVFDGAFRRSRGRGNPLSATLGVVHCGNAKHAYADKWLMSSRSGIV
jgi:hypothetical protein